MGIGAEAEKFELEQAVPLNGGNGQLISAAFDVHPFDVPTYKLRAVVPHRLDLDPGAGGLAATVTDLQSGQVVGETALQPGDPFRLVWEGEVEIGNLPRLGRMRSMARVLRHAKDDSVDSLESIDNFSWGDLDQVEAVILDMGEKKGVRLQNVDDENEHAGLDYVERGVVYRRVKVPVETLGKKIVRGVEDHKIRTTLAGIGIGGLVAVTGLYLKHRHSQGK